MPFKESMNHFLKEVCTFISVESRKTQTELKFYKQIYPTIERKNYFNQRFKSNVHTTYANGKNFMNVSSSNFMMHTMK